MRSKVLQTSFFVAAFLLATNVFAQIPPGYYDSAQGLSGAQLKTALYNIINGHTEYPYSSNSTDTWDILKEADRDPNNPANVIGIYSGFSMNADAEYASGDGWNREHVWAQSKGSLGTSQGPGTDCHNLRAADISTNSAKSNRNFAESDNQYIDNSGGYSGPTQCYMGPGFTWEPRPEVKGDVARTIFYMATRYEGENGEPDLELTDALQAQGSTAPLHGRLSDLLLWHLQDPVDSAEMERNNIVYGYQNNRNPFIDHPEYVVSIWGAPPSSPPYFTSSAVTSAAQDAAYSYDITTEGGQGPRVLSAPNLPSWLIFSNSGNGNGNISGTPTALDVGTHNVTLQVTDGVDIINQNFDILVIAPGDGADVAFINEIHYDNSGTDQGEGVEIAGSAGKSLAGWSLVLYNGGNGTSYETINLSGIFTNEHNGYGFMNFSIPGMQNGAPDGIALVDNLGQVVQFLSYEGTLVASGGPANGMLSIDIGQSETSGTQVGHSLQLTGTGSVYSDFTWADDAANTAGVLNNNQIFTGSNQAPSVSITSPVNGMDFSTLDAINIAASASDSDGSVTQVEFFVDGVSVGTDNTSPYSVNWVIPNWGAYVITAEATDDGGATTTSAVVNITATESNQAPTVSITNPTNGADFSTLDPISITANASDADGSVTQVEFFVDGVSVGTDNTSPYSINWAIPNWGAYVITAEATDNDGATTTSAAINITATQPNQAPTVSITNPTNGADFSVLDPINISANASDADGSVTQVEFFVDGVSVGTDNTSPYSINWAIPNWGAYTITAEATDNDGATTTSGAINISATQPNQVPTVSITNPTNGADFSTLDPISITANASDADGSVTQVEFFVDGVSVGTDNTSPYSINWAIPNWGAYTITAEATDNDGAITNSGAINITATNVGPSTVFINEIHYDNSGGDQGEAIELAGNAGTDLAGWSLVLYNGGNNTAYNTTNLAGVFADEHNGYGFISFNIAGIQNGAPDGVALVDDGGQVIQFLSYEGTFTASGGPADGMLSNDIGQSETSSTQVGHSLQLTGTGTVYSDFTWADDAVNTFGALNNGQSFGAPPPNQVPAVSITNPVNGADFSVLDPINISANASDSDGSVTQVAFFVDGVSVGTDNTSPYSINWAIPNWGAYVITAEATDDDGATTTSVAINISATQPNQAPTVSVTLPTNGADFSVLDPINISANASDADGSVTQVEFFVDGVSVGTDVTFPYSISWPIPSWGAYVITAEATDNDGATSLSGAINITATDPAPPGGITLEHGTIPNVGSNWQLVNLQNNYTSMVVIATVHLPNGGAPAVSRVRNASGSSFEVQVQSPSGAVLNGYSIQYLVVEEGVYTVAADGIDMEAVRVNSTTTAGKNNWVFENRAYQNSYTNPVVIGQVMTANDADWSVFWASASGSRTSPPNSAGFSAGKHVGEDPDGTRLDETLGYIVLEEGSGSINGIGYSAGLGSDIVRGIGNSAAGYTYNISGLSSASEAMLSAAAMDGGDGGWPVLTTNAPVSAGAIQLGFDEDQVNDGERSHTTEQVAYLVLGTYNGGAKSSGIATAAEEPQFNDVKAVETETRISAYPNPFTHELRIDMASGYAGEVSITIHDQTGKLMYSGKHYKNEGDTAISLETSHLNAGSYVVRLKLGDEVMVKRVIKR